MHLLFCDQLSKPRSSVRFSLILNLNLVLILILIAAFFAKPVFAQPSERIALVVGNGSYRTAPLPNPKNDAEAMSELLTRAGFKVDLQLDTDLTQLQAAVQKFGTAIRNPKVKFGLFYYAGHGLQQDWKNYLVPVSANIRNASEVPKQTVDVSQLLTYMDNTQGRSFLVILDACRDNPFAATYKPSAKGLSQFDAPAGSLLAYATSPGNVALDGQGKNGLYTSFLLREFSAPGARIEDAFKRVRLSVRLASKGKQIPWESTSLEEDIFLFPTANQILSEAEKEKLLEQEMASWQEVKTVNDPEVLAKFIRQYPSGSASELAQSRLNRLLLANADKESKEQKAQAQAVAATAALEVAAREELARRRAAEAEQKRLAARREEEERRRIALVEAEKQELIRQKAAKDSMEREEQAKVAAAKAKQAEDEAKRLASLKLEKERQQAQELARAQAEQARLARAQADTALAELKRNETLKAENAKAEQARIKTAEVARLAALEAAEKERLDLAQLAREKQLLEEAALSQTLMATAPTVLTATPYFKGYAQHERSFQVGDEHRFQEIDLFNNAKRTIVRRVTKVDYDADRVIFDNNTYVSDLMGNTLVNQSGVNNSVRQFYPADLFVGKKWTTRFKQSRTNGSSYTFDYKLKVVAKESVTVPAGTFETFKIEATGFNLELGAQIERTLWVAPGVNADIAQDYRVRLRSGQVETNQRIELLSYTPAPKRASR
jgi:Caspase domain